MKSDITRALIAVLLFVAGALVWRAGSRELRLSEGTRSIVTLQYGRAAEVLDRLGDRGEDTARLRASAAYWLGGSDAAAVSGDAFLAANAAYRAAVEQGGDWRAMAARLDGVIKRYADVLRDHPGHGEAAYNYEFAVRYRAAIAARQQPVPPEPDRPDITVHGRAGAPPDTSDMKKFKVIVPMRPEERREAEEAGQRGRRIRKG